MAAKYDSLVLTKGYHAVYAFFLKMLISDAQCLINNKDIGIYSSGNGKRQPHIHSRGIGLDWAVNKLLQFSKINDVLFTLPDLFLAQS